MRIFANKSNLKIKNHEKNVYLINVVVDDVNVGDDPEVF